MLKKTKITSKCVENALKEAEKSGCTPKTTITPKKFYYVTPEEFEEKFKFYENNRGKGTDAKRINSIAESIATNNTGWMLGVVMVDTRTNMVLDGNHTGSAMLKAHKDYGVDVMIPILEVELPETVSFQKAIIMLNNSRKDWSLEEVIINCIKEGNENYINLKKMIETLGDFFLNEKGKYNWRYASALAGASQQKTLKDQTYTLTEENMQVQTMLGKQIIRLWRSAGKPKINPWVETFIVSYVRLRKEYGGIIDTDVLVKVLSTKKGKEEFEECTYCSDSKVWSSKILSWLSTKENYVDLQLFSA